jgi:hypothetical protein
VLPEDTCLPWCHICTLIGTALTASHLTVTASLITSNEAFEGSQTSQIFVWTACCVDQYNADKLLHNNNNKYWEEATKLQCEQMAAEWLQIQEHALSTSIHSDQTTLFKCMLVRDMRYEQQWCPGFQVLNTHTAFSYKSQAVKASSNALWALYMKVVKWKGH